MKSASVLSALVTLAVAIPAPVDVDNAAAAGTLQTRQSRLTRDELLESNGDDCGSAIFIYARGSTERGNMGSLGPSVASALERELGADNVLIQGVGGAYTAGLAENALPDGTSQAAIDEMIGLLELADSTCPGTQIVAGGYSQGAALAAAAIRDVDPAIRENIVGTVLFGYTKNRQNDGQIPEYPSDRLEVFCNSGDLVCNGQLAITAAHLAYGGDARGAAPEFLLSTLS